MVARDRRAMARASLGRAAPRELGERSSAGRRSPAEARRIGSSCSSATRPLRDVAAIALSSIRVARQCPIDDVRTCSIARPALDRRGLSRASPGGRPHRTAPVSRPATEALPDGLARAARGRPAPPPRRSRGDRRCGRRSSRSGAGRRRPSSLLKAESLQPIGAFKLRGAYVAAASLTPEERARGPDHLLVAATTPRASRGPRGCSASRPSSSCPPTRPADQAGAGRGGRRRGRHRRHRVATSGGASRRSSPPTRGLAIIPPYDDPRIVAGQGTVGLEIAEDLPDVAAVLVPIGGGGLASGVAAAIAALQPGDAGHRRGAGAGRRRARLARGGPDRRPGPPSGVSRTIADGTRTQSIGRLNFAHLSPAARRASSPCPRPRSRPRSGSRRRRRGWSSSRRAPCRSRRCGSARRRPASIGLDGPIVGVVSGGNVDPERYRAYLEAPIPPDA